MSVKKLVGGIENETERPTGWWDVGEEKRVPCKGTECSSVTDATEWSSSEDDSEWQHGVTGIFAKILPETRIKSFICVCSQVRWRREAGWRLNFPLKERRI